MPRQKYTYIPKEEIASITTFNNVDFENDDLLDGAYVKGRKKYGEGGIAKSSEIESAARNKADNPNWTNEKLLKEYNKLNVDLQNFNNGFLKPSKVIGGGYKSSAIAKRLAKEWLENRIAEYKMALELRGVMAKGGSVKEPPVIRGYSDDEAYEYAVGGGVEAIYTFSLTPYVEHGVQGLITPEYKMSVRFDGTKKEAFDKAQELVDSDKRFVQVEVLKKHTNILKSKKLGVVLPKMAKGGKVKFYDEDMGFGRTLGRPSGSIEKDVLKRVSFSEDDFVGNFGWKTTTGKLGDGYVYKLDDYDRNLVKDIKLKEGERIYRYFNRTSAIGGMKPLIKINVDKELLYFLEDNDNDEIIFEKRGIPALWVGLIKNKYDSGGSVKGRRKYADGGEVRLFNRQSTAMNYANGGEVATTIIQQLGGFGRIVAMTGAYNFVDLKNGVSFKLKNPKANYVKITLNGKDLYDLEVGRIRKGADGLGYKIVAQHNDVYFDQLKPLIEKSTGLYLSL